MVLDNWGSIARWTARAPVTSRGPSGIEFVRFAELGTLRIEAPAKTFGSGACGFNLYEGHLREASFASIATRADAGVAIQVSRPVERLRADGDVRTSGGIGQTLVKGHVVPLPAYAVSIQNDGDVGELSIGGSLITEGDNVITLQVQGRIGRIDVGGSVSAAGAGPGAVDGGTVDLSGITIASQAPAGGASARPR